MHVTSINKHYGEITRSVYTSDFKQAISRWNGLLVNQEDILFFYKRSIPARNRLLEIASVKRT